MPNATRHLDGNRNGSFHNRIFHAKHVANPVSSPPQLVFSPTRLIQKSVGVRTPLSGHCHLILQRATRLAPGTERHCFVINPLVCYHPASFGSRRGNFFPGFCVPFRETFIFLRSHSHLILAREGPTVSLKLEKKKRFATEVVISPAATELFRYNCIFKTDCIKIRSCLKALWMSRK